MVRTLNDSPAFNLKVVVRETGLKPDTLRVWERRYGLPNPIRTAGGHRLYSERDIATLKWLLERKEEGLSISRAVALWHDLETGGKDPLRAGALVSEDSARRAFPAISGEKMDELAREWLDAGLDFDERRAEQILSQAFALYPLENVLLELLQDGVAEIGAGWYRGEVTVQQEHFVTALAMRHLDALLMAAPPPSRPGRILVACPPGEHHAFGPLLFTFLMRRRGWDVLFLGANVPLDRLETTLIAARPDLVVFAAQRLYTASTLLDAARLLHALSVPVAFGGLIFNRIPDLIERIPGYFLGASISISIDGAERLMTKSKVAISNLPDALDAPLSAALDEFLAKRSLIDMDLMKYADDLGIPYESLQTANEQMGQNVMASLKLGSLDYLDPDFEWAQGLLENFNRSLDLKDHYLQLYRHSLLSHLEGVARPIVEWFDRFEKEAV